MTKRTRRIIISIIVVAAVAVVVLVALNQRGTATLESVRAQEARVAEMTETVSGTGSFVPALRSTVYARVSGTLEEILVEEGQRVAEGDPLLRIEDGDYVQALEKAQVTYETARRNALQQIVSLQSTYKSARRSLEQTRRSHNNNIELREADAISQEQFQQSEDALESAEEALQSARERLNLYMARPMQAEPILTSDGAEAAVDEVPDVRQAALNLEDAEQALEDTRPTAPAAGTVALIRVEEGGIVTPNAPLVRIEQLDRMTAEVQIDEVDIGKIAVGDTAEVSSDSILGETLEGTVTSIAPVVQQVGNTRVSTVEISLEGTDEPLKSGASCTARISTVTKEQALVIPITGYESRDDESFAYVMIHADGDVGASGDGESAGGSGRRYRIERRPIELGIVTVSQVEVVDGLSEGDLVATGNFTRLRDGMLVRRDADDD